MAVGFLKIITPFMNRRTLPKCFHHGIAQTKFAILPFLCCVEFVKHTSVADVRCESGEGGPACWRDGH